MRACLTAMLLSAIVIGCATTPAIPTDYYRIVLEVPEPSVGSGELSVAVRPLRATSPRETAITYVTPERAQRPYPNVAWSEPPQDLVTRAIINALRAEECFADVGLASDMTPPDWIVHGELLAFHELRGAGSGDRQAVCTISVEVRERDTGTLRAAKTFTQTQPIDGAGVPALVAALEAAAAEAVAEIAAALNAAC